MSANRCSVAAAIRMGLVFVIILAGLIAGAAGGLALQLRQNARFRGELAAVRQELAEQEILYPLYTELMRELRPTAWPVRPAASRQPVDRATIVDIPDRFAKAAASAGLTLGSVSPRMGQTPDKSRQLHVEVQAMGAYARLRDFLMAVMTWPSFVRVEQIEVKESSRMQEEFRLQFRLALD